MLLLLRAAGFEHSSASVDAHFEASLPERRRRFLLQRACNSLAPLKAMSIKVQQLFAPVCNLKSSSIEPSDFFARSHEDGQQHPLHERQHCFASCCCSPPKAQWGTLDPQVIPASSSPSLLLPSKPLPSQASRLPAVLECLQIAQAAEGQPSGTPPMLR